MTVWPVKTLGEVVRFDSETARPEDLSSKDVYVGLENIASDGTLAGLGNVSAETLKSNKARFTDKYILFGKLRPYLVKVVRPDFSGVCSTDILPINPSAELSRDYLYWYMRSPAVIEAATEASTGTTLPRVSPTILKSFEIPVPPLDEQKRIVALLDAATERVTELTACYEKARTHANNLFTSALRGALGSNPDWPVKTLGEVCELVSRGRPPSYCEVGGVIVLNQKCVRNGQIDFGPSRRTDSSVKAIPEWAYLREGDTLINSTGAGTLGRASFVSFLTEPTTFDTHLTVVRPIRDACWPAFVGLVLNGREKDIVDLAGGATGQTELPREAVRSFEIPVPPLEDQKRIVARLDLMRAKTSEMVAAYDAKLTAAKNLRQSILEAAFAGDL